METLPYQAAVAGRMNLNAPQTVPADAVFYQTANGYWIAFHDTVAAVLPPDLDDDAGCDWVEGADSLAELVSLIESGEYEQLFADGESGHDHEHGCGCGCGHHHH